MKTPNLSVRADDFTEDGSFSARKTAEAFTRIAKAFAEAMDRGIESENLREQYVELYVHTGARVDDSFPLPAINLARHMPAKLSDVRVASIENITNPAAAWTSGAMCFWRTAGDRQFVVDYISGLSASTKYRITLRLS